MKKVLMLTYHFPPEGGPAVQRVTKFVKYLIEYGYQPIILTTYPSSRIKDHSLVNDIPEAVVVRRTYDIGRFIPGDIRKKISANLFVPDKYALWKFFAIKAAIKLTEAEKIDLIFSTSPPHSVHLIAQKVAETARLPWVADFRDEWTDYPLFHQQNNQQLHRDSENLVLQRCSHLTTVTNRIKENFSKKIDSQKITVIRNGYDPDDFSHLKLYHPDDSKTLKITYCGRLNEQHSPKLFFQTLSSLKEKGKLAGYNLTMDFIGNIENRKYLKDHPDLKDMVKFHSYQPHKKCIELMAASTALLLLSTNMKNTEFLPAKMYEYFYLKKPIIAVISFPGELSQLLERYGNSYVGYENNQHSIENSVIRFLDDWRHHAFNRMIDDSFLEQYNRKAQTKTLAAIFDQMVGN